MRCRLMVVLILLAGCSGQGGRPDIVVIVIDILRRDHVGAYGYGRGTAPISDDMKRKLESLGYTN